MPTVARALAAAALAVACAACEGEKTPAPLAQTVDLPKEASAAASMCALRPVQYAYGTLKDKFLVGGDGSDALKRQAVFAKRRIQINTDGADNSYHSERISADDPSVGAINIICNAGVKIYARSVWNLFRKPEPLRCYGPKGISVDSRYADTYKAIRDNNWKPANGYAIEFNWNILAKAEPNKSWLRRLFEWDRPCVNAKGFFVSKTKLADHAPRDACDQGAYLDANDIKAFVLPQHWLAEWQSANVARWASFEPGDVVVAYRPAEEGRPETWVFGIVGDTGPLAKFGEATLAFNWQVHRNDGAIRDKVRTYRDAVGLDTDVLRPSRIPLLVLERTAAALGGDYSPANIETQARKEFAKWGGEERFKACLQVLQ